MQCNFPSLVLFDIVTVQRLEHRFFSFLAASDQALFNFNHGGFYLEIITTLRSNWTLGAKPIPHRFFA